jgi:hypothetical protein
MFIGEFRPAIEKLFAKGSRPVLLLESAALLQLRNNQTGEIAE